MTFKRVGFVAIATLWATAAYSQTQATSAAPSVLDTASKLAAVFTPIAVFSLIVAVLTLRHTFKKSSAETYFRLEEKFYHTDLMRGLRRAAADELIAGSGPYDAFDDLGDFFDFVGIMLRQGAIDVEMAHSSFYRRATAFWRMGKKREALPRGHRNRWDEFEYLVVTLERQQAKKDKKANRASEGGKLADPEIEKLLKQEQNLPSLDRWKTHGT
jgi:hypothetical protein